MYWEQQAAVCYDTFRNTMAQNKFEEILRFLHLADNEKLPSGDKFAKVRNILSMLNDRWLLYRPTGNHLSIDKSMIPYFGRHGAKQHINGKPICFGYKMWSLAIHYCYLLQCELYKGAATNYLEPELGMSGSVIVDMISELPAVTKHFLYFNNLFT